MCFLFFLVLESSQWIKCIFEGKNHSLVFAIQRLLKSHCKIVEQHVGRQYFLKMDNNLCPSSY